MWKYRIDPSWRWTLLEGQTGGLWLEGRTRIGKGTARGISIHIWLLLELSKLLLLWLLESRGLWAEAKLTKPLILRNESCWLVLQLHLLELLL